MKQVTLRLPDELGEFIEKKKREIKKHSKLRGKVSSQSVIEALIAYWKEVDEQLS